MQKSLLLEALEIVTCHWGGWVSKEDVTISKQNLELYFTPTEDQVGVGNPCLFKDFETAAW